jgi:hypothetical protein
MNKGRVLREMASLEAHLKKHKVDYSSVIGHYRRWLSTATPEEVLMIESRIVSLFEGNESLSDLYISQEEGHEVENEDQANFILGRMRLSLMDALNEESKLIKEHPKQPYVEEAVYYKESFWEYLSNNLNAQVTIILLSAITLCIILSVLGIIKP